MSNEQKKVLIIEDDPAEQLALKKLASDAGFTVSTASDGQTGFELIKQEKPDVVLLDIILPKINGFDILEFCKRDPQLKNIPIVVLTNLSDKDSAVKSKSLGAVDHIVKVESYPHDIIRKLDHFAGREER